MGIDTTDHNADSRMVARILASGEVPEPGALSREMLATLVRKCRGLMKASERDHAFWSATNHNLRTAYTKLDESENRLARAQRLTRLGDWECVLPGSVLNVSKQLLRILGRPERGSQLHGAVLEQHIHPDDRATYQHCIDQASRTGLSFDFDHRIIRLDDSVRWVRHQGGTALSPCGRPERVMGTIQDITERKEAEERLRLSAQVFENAEESVVVADAQRRIIDTNRAFERITGHPRCRAIGRDLELILQGQDSGAISPIWQALETDGRWQGELWVRRKSGERYPIWLSITLLRDRKARVTNYVAVFSDITVLKQAESRLEYLAYHDPVTGLANRSLFSDRLQTALAQAERTGSQVSLLFLDLDDFKAINDSLGHAVGDDVLAEVAKRLEALVRETDTVARLGGDELVVVLTNVKDPDDIHGFAEKVLSELARPILLDGHELIVTASVGVAVGPSDGATVSELLKKADRAMYHVKQYGKSSYSFFSRDMGTFSDRVLQTAQLRRAVENGELFLEYHPQVDIGTGSVVGLEVLARWDHPSGTVAPSQFVPLAERTGLIRPLGEWVLTEACRQARLWQDAGLPPVRICVNVSPRQLDHDTLRDSVGNALDASGFDGKYLELELTESAVVANEERSLEIIRDLRELGVGLAIDDFGVGYCNLRYLQRLPVERLKMDPSFVHRVPASAENARLAAAIISLARSLELELVVEGVENTEQLGFVRDEGCSIVQGFVFYRPLPARRIPELLERQMELADATPAPHAGLRRFLWSAGQHAGDAAER